MMDENYLIPQVFTRHKLHLHALLLQNQPWFSARDLGRFLRLYSTSAPSANSTPTNANPPECSSTAVSITRY